MIKCNLILLLAASFLFSACKKDNETTAPYTCSTCTSTPDALAANNSSSKGIYKGIFIGSTGTIMFDIANNGTSITAAMVIDGVSVMLNSTVTWVAGQVYTAPFTGTLNGSPISITFSVQANGGTPTVASSNIPGHPDASFTIVKETSNGLIECFEGSYSTTLPETGTFNIIIARSLMAWGGIARETGTTIDDDINGTILNNTLTESQNGQPVGTLSGDQLSGSFVDGNGSRVTVTGRRTL